MDDFAQPLMDPFGDVEDLLHEDLPDLLQDPLQDPLQLPLEDPNESMLSPLAPDIDPDFNRFDYTKEDLDELFQDDLAKALEQVEDSIEGSIEKPPVEPVEPELFEDKGWGIATPSVDSELDGNPLAEQAPTQPGDGMKPPPAARPYVAPGGLMTPSLRPRGGMGAGIRNTSSRGQPEERYCPIEGDYVSQDFCEDQDCEYYHKDSDSESGWYCTYYEENP